jgi:hypothetical protein
MAAVTVAAAIAFAAPMVVAPEEAFARDVQPYAGLTPCKKNAGFKKREKQEIKALTKRLNKVSGNGGAAPRDGEKILFWIGSGRREFGFCTPRQKMHTPSPACSSHGTNHRTPVLHWTTHNNVNKPLTSLSLFPSSTKIPNTILQYDAESAPALALNATIEKTKTRFATYGEQGLLCGADGLPHLIVDGNLEHLGEFAVPGIAFLYTAGWIGYAGRSYVMLNKETAKKPTEGEIIINVPMALGLMMAAGAWPVKAFFELKNGTLTAPASEITVSPR